MPRSDNLYSADDSENSDRESFSEELSPSDGYFNRGNVPNTIVQDPSISKDDKAEDKTLIPPPSVQSRTGGSSRTSLHSVLPRSLPSHNYASHRSDNAPSNSPSSYTPTSPVSPRRRDAMFSERSALIHGPPPAYSSSPPEVPLSPRETEGQRYRTFPEHHLERGFLPGREPESMGGPVEHEEEHEQESNETTPLTNEPKPARLSVCRGIAKKILLIALFVVVVVSLISALAGGSSNKTKDPSEDDPSKDPSKSPVDDMPPPPIDADGPYCSIAKYKNDAVTYEFPVGKDLTVLQTTHGDQGSKDRSVSTAGEIRLRRLPKDSMHGSRAYFTLDVHVSDPELVVIKSWDEDSRMLKISTPRYAPLGPGQHCVSVGITAWFPEDAEFNELLFESVTLTMRVMDDIKVKVTGWSRFSSLAGQVIFPTISVPLSHEVFDDDASIVPTLKYEHPFSSRRILIETESGSITGTYPLMDFLGLDSQAGQISVDVIPHKVLESAPAPADLEVKTSSGSIKVNCPIRYVPPPRNYITHVHSSAGSVDGSFYLGSLSSFGTSAGGIRIDGLPVLQACSTNNRDKNERPNVFETRTVSGGTKVQVLDPIFISALTPAEQPKPQPVQKERPGPWAPIGDGDPHIITPPNVVLDQNLLVIDPRTQYSKKKLDSLKSVHSSNAASVEVSYPENWVGTLHAKSVSGSITVTGDDIRIIRERKGFASKEILARKGVEESEEGSYIEMQSVAGSLGFVVGR
ncbi:uncharacterized protein LY89DRAFT_720265 [Mollisia scopiformis]|uniref:Uncharacterized protein n=1 Tax=Mollisia scopiformis TaxID=149040 RepID=A0A194X4Q1_MOLSC|nr:uncharacterized protein LY89DRAFT_720265 [Mollisia scopiformis]KUJ14797.1 hypothetical protein LY89DRAFT_720265 [Mollisia scopiformis]